VVEILESLKERGTLEGEGKRQMRGEPKKRKGKGKEIR